MRYQFDWSAVIDPSVWLGALGITLSYAVGTTLGGLVIGVFCGQILLSRTYGYTLPSARTCRSSAARLSSSRLSGSVKPFRS